MAISAQVAEVFLLTDLFGGLRSCRQVAILLRSRVAGFFGILLVLKRFLVFSGIRKFSEVLLRVYEQCSVNYSPCLLVVSLSDE